MENLVQIIDRSEIMDKEAIIQDQINLLLEEQKKAASLDEKLKIASTIASMLNATVVKDAPASARI